MYIITISLTLEIILIVDPPLVFFANKLMPVPEPINIIAGYPVYSY